MSWLIFIIPVILVIYRDLNLDSLLTRTNLIEVALIGIKISRYFHCDVVYAVICPRAFSPYLYG